MTNSHPFTSSREYHVVVMGAGEPPSLDHDVHYIRGLSANINRRGRWEKLSHGYDTRFVAFIAHMAPDYNIMTSMPVSGAC